MVHLFYVNNQGAYITLYNTLLGTAKFRFVRWVPETNPIISNLRK